MRLAGDADFYEISAVNSVDRIEKAPEIFKINLPMNVLNLEE